MIIQNNVRNAIVQKGCRTAERFEDTTYITISFDDVGDSLERACFV